MTVNCVNYTTLATVKFIHLRSVAHCMDAIQQANAGIATSSKTRFMEKN